MNDTTLHDAPTEVEQPSGRTETYSNYDLFEFANHLGSLGCPHADLAVAFAAYMGLNVEMICSAWEYRLTHATPPSDKRWKLLVTFDEIVALIRRTSGT